MNESLIAREIRRTLDASAERLPYRITHRLEAARRKALARVPQTVAEAQPALAPAAPKLAFATGGEPVPFWARVAMTALPVLVLVAGLAAISIWADSTVADETADDVTAMLVDEVPISAYADRGFGAFLKNVQP